MVDPVYIDQSQTVPQSMVVPVNIGQNETSMVVPVNIGQNETSMVVPANIGQNLLWKERLKW